MSTSDLAEESMNLKSRSNYSVWGTKKKKKNEEKWIEPQRPIGHHQPYQYMDNRSQRRRKDKDCLKK